MPGTWKLTHCHHSVKRIGTVILCSFDVIEIALKQSQDYGLKRSVGVCDCLY